jgi:hypothetical protein
LPKRLADACFLAHFFCQWPWSCSGQSENRQHNRQEVFVMAPTKDSDNVGYRLIVVLVTLVLAGLLIPQEILEKNELFLLWIVMAFVGWLWIQAGLEGIQDY